MTSTPTEYAVTDPSTGELVRTYPTDTDEQVMAAVAAAVGSMRRRCARPSTA